MAIIRVYLGRFAINFNAGKTQAEMRKNLMARFFPLDENHIDDMMHAVLQGRVYECGYYVFRLAHLCDPDDEIFGHLYDEKHEKFLREVAAERAEWWAGKPARDAAYAEEKARWEATRGW